jgi:hypothetical protein
MIQPAHNAPKVKGLSVIKSTMLAGMLALACDLLCAAKEPRVIAAGDWSEPVTADSSGCVLRGRLVVCEKRISDERREAAIYVELQDARESVGGGTRVFCDFGKTDFRPEYGQGLKCELRDKDGELVKSEPFPFSGAVPRSQWITLPSDATIRLRSSPFGIHRKGATALAPDPGALWIIRDGDPDTYELSGEFTASRGAEGAEALGEDRAWTGTIKLPPVRLTGRMGD